MVYLPIYLVVDTFPVIVIKGIVLSPLLDKYLLPLTSQNQNLPRDSIEKTTLTTTSGNVSIVGYSVSLGTMLLLDLVTIH